MYQREDGAQAGETLEQDWVTYGCRMSASVHQGCLALRVPQGGQYLFPILPTVLYHK